MFQVKSILLLSPLKRLPSMVAVRGHTHVPGKTPARQAKILNKLVNNSKKKKHKEWFDGDGVSKPTVMGSTNRPNKNSPRRVAVLNKLFMKNVTDLLATNQLGEEISGFGIEISRVQVCQNYHGLNVFWYSTATDDKLLTIEKRLAQIAGPLRHELSVLRLMGEVPRITFVKDIKYASMNEVDVLLATADFGEDHIPNPYGQRVRKDFDPTNAIDCADDSSSDLIPMRNDLFGVDRNAIMGRIERSLAKTKHAWEAFQLGEINAGPRASHTESTFDSLQTASTKEKRCAEVLENFLAKRKLDRKLKLKNEMDSRQLLEEEPTTDYREEWENDEEYDDDDDDDDDVYLKPIDLSRDK